MAEKKVTKEPVEKSGKEESGRPMAVSKITIEDKYEALEARVAALEKLVDEHQRYHFGRRVE